MNMWVESSRPKSLSMATHHQSERIAHSENTYAACDESDETHDAVMAEIDLPRCQYDLEIRREAIAHICLLQKGDFPQRVNLSQTGW